MTEGNRWIALAAIMVASTASAEIIEGRSACGAHRLDVRNGGTFKGELCEGALKIEGTHAAGRFTATRVQISGMARPTDLRQLRVPPFDARSPASIDAFASPFEALRLAESLMREAVPEGGFSNAVGEAASLLSGVGGDIGCSDAENATGAVIDIESSVRSDNFYVPPWCIVIVNGPVEVKSLRVDGVFIRSFGAIRAETVRTGTLTGGAFGGYIAAFGVERSTQARQVINAVDSVLGGADSVPGPGLLVANEVTLEGGGARVDGADLQRLTVSNASFTALEALRAPVVTAHGGGKVSAGKLECDRAEGRGGSFRVQGDWTGRTAAGEALLEAGGHDAGALKVDQVSLSDGTLSVRGLLSTPLFTARSATVTTQDAQINRLVLTSRSRLTARGNATGRDDAPGEVTLTDSALHGGTIRIAMIQGTGSMISADGVLETQLLRGEDTDVHAGQQLKARAGEALVLLERGDLQVIGRPVTGAPGFEGCAAHVPQIDVGRLDVREGSIDATHLRVDSLSLRGEHLLPKNPDTVAMCLEVTRSTDVDGVAGKVFLTAPRLYASLGDAVIGKNAELVISPSGGEPTQAPQQFPGTARDHRSGASFGGFGGTSADLNYNLMYPAEEPGTRPELGPTASALDFREGGVGGWGKKAGTGGGTIRLRAESLVFEGQARANGADGVLGNSGGTGGTIHVEVTRGISGSGLFQTNGGGGGFGDPGSLTAGGGSAGRIRIDCEHRRGWNGRTETFGGLGGSLGAGNEPIREIPAWDDWRNHGGPGTAYWKVASGPDALVIEGPLDGAEHRGVGFLTGEYPDADVVVKRATVATKGFSARSLSILDGGRVVPNDPRLRVPFPIRVSHLPHKPASHRKGLASVQLMLPLATHADPLDEQMTLELETELRIDRTSSLDVSRFGGVYRKADTAGGANRAGGSHGGYGGLGRAGEPGAIGRPTPPSKDVLEPTLPGEGGFGGEAPPTKPDDHYPMILGGIGGGVLRVEAGGTVQVDGAIRADGDAGASPSQDYHGHGTGGGAGGSIWISAKALAGSGVISASGGDGTEHATADQYGGGGGGGRMRLDVADVRQWRGKARTHGGKGASLTQEQIQALVAAKKTKGRTLAPWSDARNDGGPGTIVWNVSGKPPEIRIDGVGAPVGAAVLEGEFPEHTVVVRGARLGTSSLKARALRVIEGGRLVAADQRTWLHPRRQAKGWRPIYWWAETRPTAVALAFAKSVEIDTGSAIDVSGAGGFPLADEHCGRGAFMNRAGGSHGGTGGTGRDREKTWLGCPLPVSGAESRPATPGGGGYGEETPVDAKVWPPCRTAGSGGAAIRIEAAVFKVDGRIVSDGSSGPGAGDCAEAHGMGGGAGGSVWLVGKSLEGRGVISASGAPGQASTGERNLTYGGGGAGGRIHVETQRCGFKGKLLVNGGFGGSGNGVRPRDLAGNPGTVAGSCAPRR